MPTRYSRQPTAFTLAELLVVMVITVLLAAMIHQIFNQASQAVRLGMATQDVVNKSRTISQQLVEDASRMVGPANPGGGVLIILQHVIGDWNNNGQLDGDTNHDGIIGPGERAPITHPDGVTQEGVPFVQLLGARTVEYRRFVRSDQLVFIADATGWEPRTPGRPDAFTNSARARYARIWYGHGWYPGPWGLGFMDYNNNGNRDPDEPIVAALGQETDLSVRPPRTALASNRLANRWILARQAVFLAGVTSPADSVPPGATFYAQPAPDDYRFYLANVVTAGYPPSFTLLLHGTTDVTNWSLNVPDGTGTAPEHNLTGPNGWLVGSPSPLPAATYCDRAFDLAFPGRDIPGLPTWQQRLWVNPYRPKDAINPSQGLLAWQIAQMHGLLAENVSDFIVEFAGDLDNNGKIDTLPDGSQPGIAYPAGTDSFGRPYAAIPSGQIIWYTARNFANYPGGPNGYDSTKPLLFFPSPSAYSPYVDDPDLANATAAFVWRHDDDDRTNSKWPYLIRIRYRLHDPDGRLTSGSGTPESGRWFEQIIKVNRP